MKYSLFLILGLLLLIPINEAFAENPQITISNSGNAKIVEHFSPKSTVSNIVVDAISNNISNIIAVDKKGIFLDTSVQDSSIKIATLGATSVKLSYHAEIISNDSGLWKISYSSNKNSYLILPTLANIISVNNIPLDIIDDVITMPPGQISVSYTLREVSAQDFLVYVGEIQYTIQILTGSTIENFIHSDKKISFNVDDNMPILLIIPNSIISELLEVTLNSDLINYQNYFQNNDEFWLRIEPTSSGQIQILEKIPMLQISQTNEQKGGGCLIATATYGSELAPQVQQLRELRDNKLLQTESGASFMNTFNDFYYSFSPIIADYERENTIFKEIVKIAITPMISSLSILNYVDMDSESEVLGYGISLIILNLAMYLGVPAVVIVGIRKRF